MTYATSIVSGGRLMGRPTATRALWFVNGHLWPFVISPIGSARLSGPICFGRSSGLSAGACRTT